MSDPIRFLERQVEELLTENHSLKNEILAQQHYMLLKIKETKSVVRELPDRQIHMDLQDFTQMMQYLQEDFNYYTVFDQLNQNTINQQNDIIQDQIAKVQNIALLNDQKDSQYSKEMQQTQQKHQQIIQDYQRRSVEEKQCLSHLVEQQKIEIEALKSESQKFKDIIDQQQQQISELTSSMTRECSALEMRILKQRDALDNAMKDQSRALHKQKLHYEEQMKNHDQQSKQQLEESKSNSEMLIKELQDQLEEVKQSQRDIDAQKSVIEAELEQMKLDMLSKDSNIKIILNSNDRTEREKNNLNQQLKEEQQKSQQLQTQVKSLQEKIQQCQVAKEEAIQKYEYNLKETKNKFQSLGFSQIDPFEEVKHCLKQLRRDCKDQVQQIEKLNDNYIHQQAELQQVQCKLVLQEKQNKQQEEYITTLNEQQSQFQGILQKLVIIGKHDKELMDEIQNQCGVNFEEQLKCVEKTSQNPLLFASYSSQSERPSVGQVDEFIIGQQIEGGQKSEAKSEVFLSQEEYTFVQKRSEVQSVAPRSSEKVSWCVSPTFSRKISLIKQPSLPRIEIATQTENETRYSSLVTHSNLINIVQAFKPELFKGTNDQESQTQVQQTSIWTQTIIQEPLRTSTPMSRINIATPSTISSSHAQRQDNSEIYKVTKALLEREKEANQKQHQIQIIHGKLQEKESQLHKQFEEYNKLNDQSRATKIELQKIKDQLNTTNIIQEQIIRKINAEHEYNVSQLKTQNERIINRLNSTIENQTQKIRDQSDVITQLNDLNHSIKKQNSEKIHSLNSQIDEYKKEIASNQTLIQQLNKSYQAEKESLQSVIQGLELKIQNREPREEDTQLIEQLTKEGKVLEEQLQKNFKQIRYANDIIKYTQLELENYKKSYNFFQQPQPHVPQKRQSQPSIDEDENILHSQTCNDQLPSVLQSTQLVQPSYRLSDFEIKKHRNPKFFRQSQQGSPAPTLRKNGAATHRFHNPFENDNILCNATKLVQELKKPVKHRLNKTQDMILLNGYKLEDSK